MQNSIDRRPRLKGRLTIGTMVAFYPFRLIQCLECRNFGRSPLIAEQISRSEAVRPESMPRVARRALANHRNRVMIHFRTLSIGILLLSALGNARGAEPSDSALLSSADVPTIVQSTPGQTSATGVAPVITKPRDGHCVEAADATEICSIASGRSHFYSCTVGGAPPKPLPACKGVGGATHWCCF
jgi:hypothetical protein